MNTYKLLCYRTHSCTNFIKYKISTTNGDGLLFTSIKIYYENISLNLQLETVVSAETNLT